MAANIARKGFPLSVWNRSHERAAALVTLGAKPKSTPRECVQGARVIVTMLSDEKALFEVLLGDDGVLAGADKDAVIVDMSTVGRAAALKAAQLAKDGGLRFVDAPVSGSTGPAEKGELVALVGGRLNDVTRAQPVILAMCKRIIHAGDVGQGQALKVSSTGSAPTTWWRSPACSSLVSAPASRAARSWRLSPPAPSRRRATSAKEKK